MKRLLRWIGIALGSLAVLGIITYGVLYVLSERVLRRAYAVPTVVSSIPTDPASIIEGQRLATIHGCLGCHGKRERGSSVSSFWRRGNHFSFQSNSDGSQTPDFIVRETMVLREGGASAGQLA